MIKDHFPELLLTLILIGMMGFVSAMSRIHNDSLAAEGVKFAGQVLAAILTATVTRRLPAFDASASNKADSQAATNQG